MKYTLGDRVYDGVKRDIATGKYLPNSFLSEGQIAAQYAVSKAPVKTALARLCDEGLLIRYARKGYLVTNTSNSDYAKILQVRYAIEALAVSYLARYAAATDIAELRRIAALEKPTNKKYSTVNAQFHMAMAELTGNRYLVQCLDKLMLELEQIYSYLDTRNRPLSEQDYHRGLLDAIAAKDQASALAILEQDISDPCAANRYEIISYNSGERRMGEA